MNLGTNEAASQSQVSAAVSLRHGMVGESGCLIMIPLRLPLLLTLSSPLVSVRGIAALLLRYRLLSDETDAFGPRNLIPG